jgi:hypothetical protein
MTAPLSALLLRHRRLARLSLETGLPFNALRLAPHVVRVFNPPRRLEKPPHLDRREPRRGSTPIIMVIYSAILPLAGTGTRSFSSL